MNATATRVRRTRRDGTVCPRCRTVIIIGQQIGKVPGPRLGTHRLPRTPPAHDRPELGRIDVRRNRRAAVGVPMRAGFKGTDLVNFFGCGCVPDDQLRLVLGRLSAGVHA
jgi:hypothetical protein